MKTLNKLVLVATILTTAVAARAEWVNGYTRGNGTYVNAHYRTSANNTPYDNQSYRGYPSQQPGYVSPRNNSFDSDLCHPRTLPAYGSSSYNTGLRPYTGYAAPKPLYGDSRSSGFGF